MSTTQAPITSADTLADLAATHAGASRVFHRHGLDFCCHGRVSLEEVCAKKGLAVETLIAELQQETQGPGPRQLWEEKPLGDLVDHILANFHEPHRAELPRLHEMASKVERVHAEKSTCPKGLAAHLERMTGELEEHMQKEEQVLFPLLRAGRGRAAMIPIQVMEEEHQEHALNLERLRQLTNGYQPPEEACGTWQALYLGLAEFEREIMEHIHTENNVLFPRALNG